MRSCIDASLPSGRLFTEVVCLSRPQNRNLELTDRRQPSHVPPARRRTRLSNVLRFLGSVHGAVLSDEKWPVVQPGRASDRGVVRPRVGAPGPAGVLKVQIAL